MKNIKKYIDQPIGINFWRGREGKPLVDADNLTNEDAQDLFNQLDGELSPENLCCDGELPMAQVRKKARMLHAAGKDLLAAGFTPESEWSEFK